MQRARRGPPWRSPLVIGAVGLLLGAVVLISSSRETDPPAADAARTVVPLSLPGTDAAQSGGATAAPGPARSTATTRAAAPVPAPATTPSETAAAPPAASPAPASGDRPRGSRSAEVLAAVDAPAAEPAHGLAGKPAADGEAPRLEAGDAATTERLDLRIGEGESLYVIFQRHRLSQADMLEIARLDRRTKALSRLRPGQRLLLAAAPEGRVEALALERRDGRALLVRREGGRYASDVVGWDALPALLAEPGPSSERPDPASVSQGRDASRATELRAAVALEEEPGDGPGDGAGDGPEDERQEAVTGEAVVAGAPGDGAGYVPQAVTVGRGDSLYAIFRSRGLRVADLNDLLSAGTHAKGLTRLRPGQSIEVHADASGAVGRLVVPLDGLRTLHVERGPDGFRERVVESPVEHREASASGSIESSLFLSGQRAGLPDKTIMELVELFGWDVDFALDIRSGDRFAVIYEELYVDGEKLRNGPILAAEFVNRGRVLRAVRFVDPDGRAEYYSPDGKSMRKEFLRTPVNFTRISSRFSLGRRHPILHRIRAHRGVDYAAPRGTPVRAAGDGRIELAGRRGGYGKTVIIQHGSARSTLYAHLSRFGRGIKRGRRVRQGQVIGYVGATGLATGPHLHYEFRVRGVHKDPLRIKLPPAAPIDESLEADFEAQSAPLLARLETVSRTVLAVRD